MGTLFPVRSDRTVPLAVAVLLVSASSWNCTDSGGNNPGGTQTTPNTSAEHCSNGVDDDRDGQKDCDDDDCSAALACNKVCVPAQVDLGKQLPIAVHDTLKNTSGTALRNICQTNAKTAERTYLWTAPDSGTYVFDTFGSGRPSIFALINPLCPGGALTCANGGTSNQRSLTIAMKKGQPIVVVVSIDESESTSSSGNDEYDLHINAQLTSETRCFDLADEDGDGRADCDDPDCRNAPECAALGCVDEKLGEAAPVERTGSLRDERNHFGGSCGGGRQKERIIEWTAPASGEYVFDATGTEFTTTMYLRRGSCTGAEIGCSRQWSQGYAAPQLRAQVAAGETILIVMDATDALNAFNPGENFKLRVWRVEAENCNDGLDNDMNGAMDAGDPACAVSRN